MDSRLRQDILDVEEWVQRQQAKRDLLESQLAQKRRQLEEKESRDEDLRKARWVLTEVVKRTQLRFKGYVETLVTKCINTVFDRDFEFVLNYEIKANKTYIQPLVKEGGNEPQVPKEEMGVGILDLLSFALRVVLWSLERPRSRAVFILDEPMRDLGKGKLLDRAGDVLRELSQRLGFQLIVITHEPQLSRIADRTFRIEHDGKHSYLVDDGGGGEEKKRKEEVEKRVVRKRKRRIPTKKKS